MKLSKQLTYFRGGIHPNDAKQSTEGREIVELKPPETAVLPLSQHIGRPAKPLVQKGDRVLKGQKIGEADGKISAPVHASIAGTVKDICAWNHPVISSPVPAVIIESDGSDAAVEYKNDHKDYFRYSPAELREVINEAGIVGMGGATFPAHVKLAPPGEIDVIIINGCECEPYLTCDYRLMLEHMKDIVSGLKIMMYILDAGYGVIALEDNKPAAAALVRDILKNEPNIGMRVVKTKYPQGAEKQLIKTVLNKEVPSGKLPLDVKVVVHNVATSYAVSKAVIEGIPLFSRIVTVTGASVDKPGNYLVRNGTLLQDVLMLCGITPHEGSKIIFGGPMMGIAQANLDVPLIKGTSGVLVLQAGDTDTGHGPCIRCARCNHICPMNLMPNMISVYAESRMWDKTALYYPKDCIECGCCAYICPAKRPIVQHVKLAKLNNG